MAVIKSKNAKKNSIITFILLFFTKFLIPDPKAAQGEIEIGQIIIALTVLLTLFIMKRMMNNANLHSFRNILSASLVSIGAYWFLIRSII